MAKPLPTPLEDANARIESLEKDKAFLIKNAVRDAQRLAGMRLALEAVLVVVGNAPVAAIIHKALEEK